MRMPDHVLGIVLFAASITYAAMAASLPGGSPGDYGPELFPLLIAGGLAASSIALMLRRFRRKPTQATEEVESPDRNWLNGAVVCGVVIYSIFAMPVLGFVLTICPALIMILALLGVRFWHALLIGVAATFTVDFAFRTFLHVPLPTGPGLWGFI